MIKKITENDMTNIVSLNIQNENISSLEGLQYASNLKKLTVRIKIMLIFLKFQN